MTETRTITIDIKKYCNFKKIKKDERIKFQGGYVTNGKWIFKIDWLMQLQRKKALGMVSLYNRILRDKIQNFQDRIAGNLYNHNVDLEKYVSSIDMSEYKELDIAKVDFLYGFYRAPHKGIDLVMQFSDETSAILDIEYSAAFYFDPETKAFAKNETSPIVITNKENEIVFMIAPDSVDGYGYRKNIYE